MNQLQKWMNSDSPKLQRPFASAVGFLMQRTGLFEWVSIDRGCYKVPFFSTSNVALTLWSVPNYLDHTEQFVRHYLRPGEVFVDIGANIGCVSSSAAVTVGAEGKVYALEPHPVTFNNLRRTLEFNRLTNASCYRLAATARPGTYRITDARRKDDGNRLVASGGLSVVGTSLDQFMKQHAIGLIDLLKIDVEGHECEVLFGLPQDASTIRCIYLESIDRVLRLQGASESMLIASLKSRGYRLFRRAADPANLVALLDVGLLSRCPGTLDEI